MENKLEKIKPIQLFSITAYAATVFQDLLKKHENLLSNRFPLSKKDREHELTVRYTREILKAKAEYNAAILEFNKLIETVTLDKTLSELEKEENKLLLMDSLQLKIEDIKEAIKRNIEKDFN